MGEKLDLRAQRRALPRCKITTWLTIRQAKRTAKRNLIEKSRLSGRLLTNVALGTLPSDTEKEAVRYDNQIKSSLLHARTLQIQLDVFVNWLERRFADYGKKEIEKMLIGTLPDLRETQSGKDLILIGREEGKIEGKIEGLILILETKFGPLDEALQQRINGLSSIEQN